jgi:hypothetical protein
MHFVFPVLLVMTVEIRDLINQTMVCLHDKPLWGLWKEERNRLLGP